MQAAVAPRLGRATQVAHDLLTLSKYRLSALVAFTAGVGYAARSEPTERNETDAAFAKYRQLSATVAGTWLAAASANTLNHMYERRSDALMPRTRLRPLPTGRLAVAHAACFALVTGVSGVALLAVETNRTAAALAAANVLLYSAVYTPLKPLSTVNTVVGALVGALPPIHGWAAASGGHLLAERERGAFALGTLLFLWQIPHFHALAVVCRADYAAARLKMLAVSNPRANAIWARRTAAAMLPVGALFTLTGLTSPAFVWQSALLGCSMYRRAVHMVAHPTSVTSAKHLFRASIWYLPISMSLMLIDLVPYASTHEHQQPLSHSHSTTPDRSEIRLQQPWEIMAPFPFLPVPCGVPAVVLETPHKTPNLS
ncbi:unnamed protein product [Agarophyton chilense]